MKIYHKGSFWFTVLVLVSVLIVVVVSFGYSEKARLVPLMVGIPTLMLTILMLLGVRYPRLIGRFDISVTDLAGGGSKAGPWSEAAQPTLVKNVLTLCGWIAGLFILIWLVGFLIATPVFILLFLKIYGRARWLNALIITIVAGGFIYGMFEVVMKVGLFQGILFGEIVPKI